MFNPVGLSSNVAVLGAAFAAVGSFGLVRLPTFFSRIHAPTLGDAINRWDITRTNSETVRTFFRAAPGGVPTQVAFSQEARWDELDTDGAADEVPPAYAAAAQRHWWVPPV